MDRTEGNAVAIPANASRLQTVGGIVEMINRLVPAHKILSAHVRLYPHVTIVSACFIYSDLPNLDKKFREEYFKLSFNFSVTNLR